MSEAKITAYREAVDQLSAAMKELKMNPPDWNAAFKRVQEIAELCALRRRALNEF